MLNENDVKKVKGEGFLRNRGTDCFSARVVTENGVLTAEQMICVCEAAKLYGNGNVSFTSRLTVEVPGIHFDNIESFKAHIAKVGLFAGGTGPRVRPVVACKGTTCVFGLYDTQAMAKAIHDRFYIGYRNVTLPHKLKIACGGCPNNCVKPDINDIGIIGQRVPKLDAEKCRSCGKCAVAEKCPMKAVSKDGELPSVNADICNNCGRCISACPFGAVDQTETMYRVYLGGRWGKICRRGEPIPRLYTYDEALDVVEKAILLYKRDGIVGERFADTVARIGIDKVAAIFETSEIIDKKNEILE